jgi:hypothetical protein
MIRVMKLEFEKSLKTCKSRCLEASLVLNLNLQARFLKILARLIVIVLFGSCQTIQKTHEPPVLPVVLQPLFASCSPSEGDASFEIKKDTVRVLAGNLVWSFVKGQESVLQINSPFGDTIFEMRSVARKWTTTGDVQLDISETKSGILKLGRHELPLKSDELGCLLAGAWPAQWLSWLEKKQDELRWYRMMGYDGQRSVVVEFPKSGQAGKNSNPARVGCAYVTWGGFLGFFQKKSVICREQKKGNLSVSLSGINSYIINWTVNDAD